MQAIHQAPQFAGKIEFPDKQRRIAAQEEAGYTNFSELRNAANKNQTLINELPKNMKLTFLADTDQGFNHSFELEVPNPNGGKALRFEMPPMGDADPEEYLVNVVLKRAEELAEVLKSSTKLVSTSLLTWDNRENYKEACEAFAQEGRDLKGLKGISDFQLQANETEEFVTFKVAGEGILGRRKTSYTPKLVRTEGESYAEFARRAVRRAIGEAR